MIKFDKEMILTGIEKKMSKKGNEYYVINFLDDNGLGQQSMFKGDTPNDQYFKGLEKLKPYLFTFQVTLGKYKNCDILNLQKV